MTILMRTPGADDLERVVGALDAWQYDDAPLQLHSGDLGWYSLRGAAATAAALRVWSRDETILALGLLDGPELLRMALDPGKCRDEELAAQLAADVDDPQRGVLAAGEAAVEARGAEHLSRLLSERGWQADEPWTPFHLDLSDPDWSDPVDRHGAGLRVETIGPDRADLWVGVHGSAFRGPQFTEEYRRTFLDRWHTMVEGPFYPAARSLAAFDAPGEPVAVATAWSAGPGRPGLLEPMGVHPDHRGRGYGVAITRAAASALCDMGSSSAIVCTPSSKAGAVATYAAAGFTAHPQVADLRRSA